MIPSRDAKGAQSLWQVWAEPITNTSAMRIHLYIHKGVMKTMDNMQGMKRTCYCGEVLEAGKTVTVGGFVDTVLSLIHISEPTRPS